AMRDEKPVLPGVLSVNLEGQHGTLLGGSVIGRIMEVLFRLELACAAAILVTLIAQWMILRPTGGYVVTPLLRVVVYLGAVVLMIYHWRVLWPRMWKQRQEDIDHAHEPAVANPAPKHLDRLQGEGAMVGFFLVALLGGRIVFS